MAGANTPPGILYAAAQLAGGIDTGGARSSPRATSACPPFGASRAAARVAAQPRRGSLGAQGAAPAARGRYVVAASCCRSRAGAAGRRRGVSRVSRRSRAPRSDEQIILKIFRRDSLSRWLWLVVVRVWQRRYGRAVLRYPRRSQPQQRRAEQAHRVVRIRDDGRGTPYERAGVHVAHGVVEAEE